MGSRVVVFTFDKLRKRGYNAVLKFLDGIFEGTLIGGKLKVQFQPVKQDILVGGLGDKIHGPRFKGPDFGGRVTVAGKKDHRYGTKAGVFLEPGDGLEPVHIRHLDVQEDKVGPFLSAYLQGQVPGFSQGNLVMGGKLRSYLLEACYVVIYHQYLFCHRPGYFYPLRNPLYGSFYHLIGNACQGITGIALTGIVRVRGSFRF
jgi:hypothetical protein